MKVCQCEFSIFNFQVNLKVDLTRTRTLTGLQLFICERYLDFQNYEKVRRRQHIFII